MSICIKIFIDQSAGKLGQRNMYTLELSSGYSFPNGETLCNFLAPNDRVAFIEIASVLGIKLNDDQDPFKSKFHKEGGKTIYRGLHQIYPV